MPTAVITGGTSGVGLETARALIRCGWRAIVTGRDNAKLETAVSELARARPGSAKARFGDFGSFASVRRLAAELAEEEAIDVLVNNVGIALTHKRQSSDGNDMMLQVNHLSHFLLTNLLLTKLKAQSAGRILNVASRSHRGARDYGFDDFQFRTSYSVGKAYARTKLYNVLFTRALAARLSNTAITANALHPGSYATGIGNDGDFEGWRGLIWPFVQRGFMDPADQAARVTFHLATAPELNDVSGAYFSTDLKPVAPSQLAQSDEAAEILWATSARLVGLE